MSAKKTTTSEKGTAPKVHVSLDEVKKVEAAVKNLEETVGTLPESTFKRSFASHLKYMNKNIQTRNKMAHTKEVIRALREGKISAADILPKE